VDNEYTLTLGIDGWPPPDADDEGEGLDGDASFAAKPVWPIYFDKKENPVYELGHWQDHPLPHNSVRVDLAFGDAMVFRGREHAHHRDVLESSRPGAPERSSTNLLLHFVDHDYPVHMNRAVHNQQFADGHR